MEIVNIRRGFGKTTNLIYESNKKDIPIVCGSKQQCCFIEEKARRMRIRIPEPICICDLCDVDKIRGGKKPERILIDELPNVLSILLGCVIDTATMTSNSLELYDYNNR